MPAALPPRRLAPRPARFLLIGHRDLDFLSATIVRQTSKESGMTLLGNIIWFFLGGWTLFLCYALGAVIFFPMFIPLFRLAVFALWPFGRDVVTRAQLDRYRQVKGIAADPSALDTTLKHASAVLNLLWMLTFGWLLALVHLVASLANLCLFFLIVTIPNIGGHWKLIRVAFLPFNKVIVPSALAQDIRNELARARLGL
jgi:uncharacterized membrane protein YccF (DUF307 family)